MCQHFTISVSLYKLWCHVKTDYCWFNRTVTHVKHMGQSIVFMTSIAVFSQIPPTFFLQKLWCHRLCFYAVHFECSWRGIPTTSVWVCEYVKTNKPLCNPGCDLSLRDTRFLLSRGSCAASKPWSQWEFCTAWVQGDTLNSWNPGRWPLECSSAVATVD